MIRIAGLTAILAVFWLVNSGYFKPLLLGLGALSVVMVIMVIRRMEKIDGDQIPLVLQSPRLPGYLLWLLREIVKSNIDVIKCVCKGPESISPTIIRVHTSQKTDLCRVLYANSITLTPGTVTLDVQGDIFEVHALTRGGAAGVEQGEMDRRVSSLEGRN